jgi:hypothetical protein
MSIHFQKYFNLFLEAYMDDLIFGVLWIMWSALMIYSGYHIGIGKD